MLCAAMCRRLRPQRTSRSTIRKVEAQATRRHVQVAERFPLQRSGLVMRSEARLYKAAAAEVRRPLPYGGSGPQWQMGPASFVNVPPKE